MKKILKFVSVLLILSLITSVFSICVSAKSADYSEIYDYLDKCIPTDNDVGIYSEDSYNNLMNIVDSVDYTLTSENQSQVDEFLNRIKDAVANLDADETKAVASYGISLSKNNAECGDIIDVYVTLDTNYAVYAASAIILYDSTVFDVVCDSTSPTAYLDYSGSLENYLHLGNWKSPSNMYTRNNNPTYWNSLQDSVKIAYIGWSADSSLGVPTKASGVVAKFSLKVREDAVDGAVGGIYMNPDWFKTASCKGGMTFVSRTVGTWFSSSGDAAIPYGQTIDISNANQSVTVGEEKHICQNGTWSVTTPATCTTDGVRTKICDECGEAMETEMIPALGHSYASVVTAPTCTADGFTTYTCSRCKDSYIADSVTAIGHTWGEWTVTSNATASASGIKTRTCSVCGVSETNEIPKVKLASEKLRLLRSRVSVDGDTIKVTGYNNTYNLVIYTSTTDEKKVEIDISGTPMTKMSNGSGYVLTHDNWKKAGHDAETTITIDGDVYNLLVTFVDVEFSNSYLKTLRTYDSEVDTSAKTITITSATDADSIDLYQYSDVDHSFEIIPDTIDGTTVSRVTSTRYRIAKVSDTVKFSVTINKGRYCQQKYTIIINFVESPFNPAKYIRPIYGGIELANDGEDYILVTMNPGKTLTGIMSVGINGATLSLDTENVVGTLDSYVKNGVVTQYRAVEARNTNGEISTPVSTNITISFEDGTQETYRIVFAFKAAGFSGSVINTTNVQSVNYDAENKKLVLSASGDTYIAIRKTTLNGLGVEIDNVSAYTNIVETDTLYMIYSPACGVFKCKLNISDSTSVDSTLVFYTHASYDDNGVISDDFINMSKLSVTRGYAEYTDGQMVLRIKEGKPSLLLSDKVFGSGEEIMIETGTGVSYADNIYTITSVLIGQHINVTIGSITYEMLVTR